MRTHTNNLKIKISKFGRQIDGRLYHYLHYDLTTESNDKLLTEDNIQLISEQNDEATKELIDNKLIYSIDIIKNGQLFQSLMKECDFEAGVELRVGDMINPQLGVLVNNAYEYLDYGNYIIYSKEYVAENQTWRYVCYDKMLYSMIQYKPLDLTYPCTIREYLIALADRIGLTFANSSDSFTNYNQPVLQELFENQNITYRDILDKLSEITASNILINDDDELELGYPNETSDTITEDNLKDVNVNFGEVFGPINKVAITETDGGYEYSASDDVSIETNGLTQININDNIFAFNGYSETIASGILNKIKGLTYSIADFKTTGVCYYDFLDLFDVSIDNTTYKCLLLNNEINITQGIEEQIFNSKLENSEKESNNFTTSVMNSKEISFKINKQTGEIQSKVSKDGVISAINQSAEAITINANKINLTSQDVINIMAQNAMNLSTNYLALEVANSTNSAFYIFNKIGNIYDGICTIYPIGITFTKTGSSLSADYNYQITILRDDINNIYTSVEASGIHTPVLTQTSKEEFKKNIEKLENALEIINKTNIYKYNLKNEDDTCKKHIGLIIGDKYNYSKEITSDDNESVDIYSMLGVCFKAIQEQQKQIEALQKRIEVLEKEVK